MSRKIYKNCVICDISRTSTTRKFFRFPVKNVEKMKKWVDFCCENGVMIPDDINNINSTVFICSGHFETDCFTAIKSNLKKGAIPTIFNPIDPPVLEAETEAGDISLDEHSRLPRPKKTRCKSLKRFRTEEMEDITQAKKMRRVSIQVLASKNKKIHLLEQCLRRTKKRINSFKELIAALKTKNFISEDAMEHLY